MGPPMKTNLIQYFSKCSCVRNWRARVPEGPTCAYDTLASGPAAIPEAHVAPHSDLDGCVASEV